MILAPALFPNRVWVDDAARGRAEGTPLEGGPLCPDRGTVRGLEWWARGGAFHRYGRRVYDELTDAFAPFGPLTGEEAVRQMHDSPAHLEFSGELAHGGLGMRWTVTYRRVGGADLGMSSGYSTVEDCAYAALSAIEQEEREAYEASLMIGLA